MKHKTRIILPSNRQFGYSTERILDIPIAEDIQSSRYKHTYYEIIYRYATSPNPIVVTETDVSKCCARYDIPEINNPKVAIPQDCVAGRVLKILNWTCVVEMTDVLSSFIHENPITTLRIRPHLVDGVPDAIILKVTGKGI